MSSFLGDNCHTGARLKLLNDVRTEDLELDKDREETKSETGSETRQESAEELLDTYDRRRLHRRGATRQSFRDVVRERTLLRQRRNRLAIESAGSSLLGQDEEANDHSHPMRHVAMSHEDTSAGAVHCFKDEFGQQQSAKFRLILAYSFCILSFSFELLISVCSFILRSFPSCSFANS